MAREEKIFHFGLGNLHVASFENGQSLALLLLKFSLFFSPPSRTLTFLEFELEAPLAQASSAKTGEGPILLENNSGRVGQSL